MRIGIFFQRQIPHVEDLAIGAERLGWDVDLRRVRNNYRGLDFDVVAIGGHLDRYDGLNGRIAGYYRERGTPVLIVEMGRMLRPEIPKHKYWFFYLNTSPSRPLLANNEDYDPRRRMLFPEVEFKPRGEDVIVIGQDREVDARMHATTLLGIKNATSRRVVWRPRPEPEPEGMKGSKFCDEVTSGTTLDEDLDRAWCVVAYTSNAAGEALRRGIPVICHHSASYAYLCSQSPMDIDSAETPLEADVVNYFRSMAQITYSNDEMKAGTPLHWFESTRQIAKKKTTVHVERNLDDYNVTLLTCTGGRQQTFTKLEEWVARQTLRPKNWVVVDDVEEATAIESRVHLIRPTPFWEPGQMTYARNFKLGLEYIKKNLQEPNWIAMFEDDDWYHPQYLEHYIPLLENAREDGILMGGEFANIYYHVGYRRWKRVGMAARNATMAATIFHSDLIPEIEAVLNGYDGLSLDLQMFHNIPQNKWVVYDTDYVVGIKGTPATRCGGTHSHTAHTVARGGWRDDLDCAQLRKFIGGDCEFYEQFFVGQDEVLKLKRPTNRETIRRKRRMLQGKALEIENARKRRHR